MSDVEDEINGFVSYDRKVSKLLPEEFSPVARRLQEETNALKQGEAYGDKAILPGG